MIICKAAIKLWMLSSARCGRHYTPALCLYAKYVQHWCACGSRNAPAQGISQQDVSKVQVLPGSVDTNTINTINTSKSASSCGADASGADPEMAVQTFDLAALRPIERFFRGPW